MIKRGTQIMCVPSHVQELRLSLAETVKHPDVEFGFVTRVNPPVLRIPQENVYACRYWRKGEPGVMRTVANSENTDAWMITEYQSVDQSLVREWLDKLEAEQMKLLGY